MTQQEMIKELGRIESTFGREYTKDALPNYYKHLYGQSVQLFAQVVDAIIGGWLPTSHERLPSVATIKTYMADKAAGAEKKFNPIPYAERATGEELLWFFKCLDEIGIWHNQKLMKFNPAGCVPMSMDEWMQAGQPETWSELFTHMQRGAVRAYRASLGTDPGALGRFYKDFYNTLVDSRRERTCGTSTGPAAIAASHTTR